METPTQKPAEEQENHIIEDRENHSVNSQNQLVPYDPEVDGVAATKARPYSAKKKPFTNHASRSLSAEDKYVAQCHRCFKWRYIPTKDKYEKIRENILKRPFNCEDSREWRPNISCDDTPDLTQDESKLWAYDKPCIPQPPLGWERILRIKAEGGTKFADVYYDLPTGERFRSKNEVERYLEQHSEYASQGVKLEAFSFQTPRPLQADYTKKRSPTPSYDINGANDVNPI